ncbi:hypothetical protein [Actinoalloteichus caeruleus]|uniref:sunset domain-containing protein n=1 Tax=Actinoalloteichus cyanogriseus TaxID=2893586 RepID=UPI0004C23C3D|nr:hypothetical protein [Actinoalloteichus caeruleus]
MGWLFSQIFLWCLVSFALGVVAVTLLVLRPMRRRASGAAAAGDAENTSATDQAPLDHLLSEGERDAAPVAGSDRPAADGLEEPEDGSEDVSEREKRDAEALRDVPVSVIVVADQEETSADRAEEEPVGSANGAPGTSDRRAGAAAVAGAGDRAGAPEAASGATSVPSARTDPDLNGRAATNGSRAHAPVEEDGPAGTELATPEREDTPSTGPYPNSVLAEADATGHPEGYPVKAKKRSMTYHTEDSPYYRRTKADIWFRSADDAERAGFAAWRARRRVTTSA